MVSRGWATGQERRADGGLVVRYDDGTMLVQARLEDLMSRGQQSDQLTQPSGEVLDEIRQWMEFVSLALAEPGVHGLNLTAMRQANVHLVNARSLMGATSTVRPDDRDSPWPEGHREDA